MQDNNHINFMATASQQDLDLQYLGTLDSKSQLS